VIIGKIEQDECGQLRSASLLSRADERGKVVEKFIGAELVGILNVEVGKVGINVAAQRSQSWQSLEARSRDRLRMLLAGEPLGAYGLGRDRTMADYARFSGIDYAAKTLGPKAYEPLARLDQAA